MGQSQTKDIGRVIYRCIDEYRCYNLLQDCYAIIKATSEDCTFKIKIKSNENKPVINYLKDVGLLRKEHYPQYTSYLSREEWNKWCNQNPTEFLKEPDFLINDPNVKIIDIKSYNNHRYIRKDVTITASSKDCLYEITIFSSENYPLLNILNRTGLLKKEYYPINSSTVSKSKWNKWCKKFKQKKPTINYSKID